CFRPLLHRRRPPLPPPPPGPVRLGDHRDHIVMGIPQRLRVRDGKGRRSEKDDAHLVTPSLGLRPFFLQHVERRRLELVSLAAPRLRRSSRRPEIGSSPSPKPGHRPRPLPPLPPLLLAACNEGPSPYR